jgi:site-specific DNA-methyltransferase (adenine-specific)
MNKTLFERTTAIQEAPRNTVGQEPKPPTGSHLLPEKIGQFSHDTVLLLDCIEGMKRLPDDSIDIAIADPPYNASKGNDWKWDNSVELPGFGGNWSKVRAEWDDMPLEDYFRFTVAWLSELKRVVRPTGSIWIHGTYHNIGIINFALQLLKIEIINEVVWYKRNSFPNLSGRRLTASHETILWAHTGGNKRRYYFNYDLAKKLSCPEDGLKEPGKQMRTVWDIPNNKDREELQHGKHPTQKPIRLLTRMLQLSAQPGSLLLAPFAGSGSDCVAAHRLGLHYLAFETDPEYVALGCKRLGLHVSAAENEPVSGATHGNAATRGEHGGDSEDAGQIPSLIKWTGSKRSQAAEIAAEVPTHGRFLEPFVGGGAMLYLLAGQGTIAGDVYAPLVALWNLVQSDPEKVISHYTQEWELLQKDLPGHYYAARERFNTQHDPLDLSFLMRTCVNGIVRFNDQGEFNNSFHLSRRGMKPARFARVVRKWHEVVKPVRFVCQDYEATVSEARAGDFVYLDPPYAGNHQRYTQDLDLQRFWTVLEKLNSRGVKWALSFDGHRGGKDLTHNVPKALYKRQRLLNSGNSAVHKVLNGPIQQVKESLYLNF